MYFFNHDPIICSDSPQLYVFAVSMKLPPHSANLSIILCDVSSSEFPGNNLPYKVKPFFPVVY